MSLCDQCREWLACALYECRLPGLGKSFPDVTLADMEPVLLAGYGEGCRSESHYLEEPRWEVFVTGTNAADRSDAERGAGGHGDPEPAASTDAFHYHLVSSEVEDDTWECFLKSKRRISHIHRHRHSCWLCGWLRLQHVAVDLERGRLPNATQRARKGLAEMSDWVSAIEDDAGMDLVTLDLSTSCHIQLSGPRESSSTVSYLERSVTIVPTCNVKRVGLSFRSREANSRSELDMERSVCGERGNHKCPPKSYVLARSSAGTRTLRPGEEMDCVECQRAPDTVRHSFCGTERVLCQCRLALVRNWIKDCRESHPFCDPKARGPEAETELPTRLISVGSASTSVRLVETNALALDGPIRYATLSHCWGAASFTVLTRQLYSQFLTAIPVDKLAKTFRQAIEVCKLIGIAYLWIDCLCIIQDTPNDADWRAEAPRMHKVYGNSALNLSATASKHAEQGLSVPKSDQFCQTVEIVMPSGTVLEEVRFPHPRGHGSGDARSASFGASPLFQRGWVLQECYLARRALHFADAQLVWTCNHGAFSEHDLYNTDSSVGGIINGKTLKFYFSEFIDDINNVESLNYVWIRVMREYSETLVTQPQDRYFALSGLAALVHKRYEELGVKTTYLAGSWSHNFQTALFWYTYSPPWHVEGPACFVPSWSWLKSSRLVISSIGYDPSWSSSTDCVFLDADITYVDPAFLYGPVESVKVRVAADRFTATWQTSDGTTATNSLNVLLQGGKVVESVRTTGDIKGTECRLTFDWEEVAGQSLQCLTIEAARDYADPYVEALILRNVGADATGACCYQRVGRLYIRLKEFYLPETAVGELDETIRVAGNRIPDDPRNIAPDAFRSFFQAGNLVREDLWLV